MAVDYHSIFITLAPYKTIPNTAVIHCHILTLGKEDTVVNYHSICITQAPGLGFRVTINE
jgi:hypothetical protein